MTLTFSPEVLNSLLCPEFWNTMLIALTATSSHNQTTRTTALSSWDPISMGFVPQDKPTCFWIICGASVAEPNSGKQPLSSKFQDLDHPGSAQMQNNLLGVLDPRYAKTIDLKHRRGFKQEIKVAVDHIELVKAQSRRHEVRKWSSTFPEGRNGKTLWWNCQ